MKVPIRFVPIEEWPGKATGFQKQSNFKSGIRDTLTLLDHELFMLGAKNVIMQAYIRPEQIRSDGSLYAGTRLARSGLILNFISKGASLSFPCDRYTKWEDNLRAIALSLEALRAVDRYG